MALGEEEFRRRVKIYATDVDDDALGSARDASYTAKQLQAIPEQLRERYPRFDEFVAVRDTVDPERRFANAYLERVLGP